MSTLPDFRRHTIYVGEPSERTLLVVGDLNNDGVPEIVIGACHPKTELYWLGRIPSGEWQRHTMDEGCGPLEAGGVLADITGDGRLDFVGAHDASSDRVLWREQPQDPTQLWTRREIFQMPANKSHDQFVADFNGDGHLDFFVGELGSPNSDHPHPPAERIYVNNGDGTFEEHIIDDGIGTHEAKLIEIDGLLGIAGKPYRNMRSEAPRGPDVDCVNLWLPE